MGREPPDLLHCDSNPHSKEALQQNHENQDLTVRRVDLVEIQPVTTILCYIQNTVQAGLPSPMLITSESDLNALQDHPNELSEELVRTVASIHQRIAESVSSSSLIRTSSQDLGASKRKFRRRSSQVMIW